MSDASDALRAAQRELEVLLAPSAYALAQARSAVVDAEAALEDARDRLTSEREGAHAQVAAARKDLDAARRRLQDAGDTSGHLEHRKAVADGGAGLCGGRPQVDGRGRYSGRAGALP